MQVSMESLGGLEHRMTVQVPVERIEEEIERRLKAMAGKTRVDGFRPGKVPMNVLRHRFGEGVFQEVISELLRSSFHEAVTAENLRLAGDPNIEPVEMGPGKPLHYQATFDVCPVIEIVDLSSVEIGRPTADVMEGDLEEMLETLRMQRAEWDPVDRESRDGDRIRIDYEGTIDGNPFEGGKAEGMSVLLGKGRFLPEFEKPLLGRKAGDECEIAFTFPADYGAPELAGKAAVFHVKVHVVEEMRLPELDETFAKSFGVVEGGMERLREDIRGHMRRELEQAIKIRLKKQVMDALHVSHRFDLPSSLVAREMARLREESVPHGMRGENVAPPDSMFEEEARRRVALGLIIAEIVKSEEIRPDFNRMRSMLESIASTYEDPQAVISQYLSNSEAMAGLEAIVIEEQVVDRVVSVAKVTDQPTSFRELTGPEMGMHS